jgi:hypothetical protein
MNQCGLVAYLTADERREPRLNRTSGRPGPLSPGDVRRSVSPVLSLGIDFAEVWKVA